jgi:hypothetical protein
VNFADVKKAIAFHKVFGEKNRKETPISFLNAVPDFSGDQHVHQVNIPNPYQFAKPREEKVTIVIETL